MKKRRMRIKILVYIASLLAISVSLVKIGHIDIDKIIDKFILNIGGTVIVSPSTEKNTSGEKSLPDKASADNSATTPIALSVDKQPDITLASSVIPPHQEPVSSEAVKDNNSHDDLILQNGIPNVGFLSDKHTTAFRTFILASPAAVDIVFRPSGKDTASYKLTVRDTFGTVLTQKDIDNEAISSNTGNLYLRAGTYRTEIANLYSWNGKPYTITVNASHAVNTEEETNDTITTANVIPLNENIRASTGTRSDVDYFTFTLDKIASVRPYLEFAPVKNYSLKLYELNIANVNGTYSKEFTFRGDARTSKAIRPFMLKPGTYIISLSRVEDKNIELGLHEYTLRVSAQEVM